MKHFSKFYEEDHNMKKWVCQVCGYVFEGENPPEKCPQCGVPASKFTEQCLFFQ